MSLQIVTPPIAEPVTLADVKLRLRLTSTADDALITQLITPARVFAEKVTRYSLVSKGYQLTMERFPWPHEPLVLPVPPVSAVSSITYLDSTATQQTWDPSEYIVGLNQVPALIVPLAPNIYPCTFRAHGINAVSVNFTAGPATGAFQIDLSSALEAVRQLTAHFYEHPEAVNSDNLKEMPYGIQALLGANKIYGF
jgi:uncharacterized phiE125 gp8 family phage protein